ncbi:MAG TPA: hypothetical protein PLI18_16775 [Pirellulaceae bacterium]|nr:hypothetical protein [Pirellulaceae bacterium]
MSVSMHAQERWLDRGDGRSIVDALKDCRRLRIVDPGMIWLGDERYAFPLSIRDMVVSTAMPIDFARSSFRKRTGRPFAEAPLPAQQTATINEIRRWLDLPADVVLIAAAGKSNASVAVAKKIVALKRAAEPKHPAYNLPPIKLDIRQPEEEKRPERRGLWEAFRRFWFGESSSKTECA